MSVLWCCLYFFCQAEDGIRDLGVTGVQTCALPISRRNSAGGGGSPPTLALRVFSKPAGKSPGRRTGGSVGGARRQSEPWGPSCPHALPRAQEIGRAHV